jgi:hypothetical protein
MNNHRVVKQKIRSVTDFRFAFSVLVFVQNEEGVLSYISYGMWERGFDFVDPHQ